MGDGDAMRERRGMVGLSDSSQDGTGLYLQYGHSLAEPFTLAANGGGSHRRSPTVTLEWSTSGASSPIADGGTSPNGLRVRIGKGASKDSASL